PPPRGPVLPGLAADHRARRRRDLVLARSEGSRRGGELPGAGAVQPGRRRSADTRIPLVGAVPAVPLAPGPAGHGPADAGPVLLSRRGRGRRRARLLAGPGAVAGTAGSGLAQQDPGGGRRAGGPAADSAAVPDGPGPGGPGRLAAGLRQAAAPAPRPRAPPPPA